MSKELPKVYDPAEVESRIYDMWMGAELFRCERDENKRPFTIVMPPPNVTGRLHMGHAWDITNQDTIIRFKRMRGFAALWLPGTDHAGIATQIKVEESLRENEGLSKHDLGREEFLARVWAWKEKYGGDIVAQQKKLGASCDWSRARFTMDEGCSRAVRENFVSLYERGLIYRGQRIIHWCPHCVTALSDAEVEYTEQAGHLWHIRYPVIGQADTFLVVATTRPETIPGDTAVAVHPSDARYAHLVGKQCVLPLSGRTIPIIADEYVDMEFGTGCVKITPGHDPNDFEVGRRHGLEAIRIMDDTGNMNALAGDYRGMERYAARRAILSDLEKGGFLLRTEAHTHNVGACYRCDTDVEPIISAQWFVKMEPLAKEAIRVVRDGEIRFIPERFQNTYFNWMEHVRDWCISRQLWWGHQIPAWYCADCGHITVTRSGTPAACAACGASKLTRDEDVLDTWFSSALWPFSTLGWPEKTADLEYFFPTDVLVTGYDIIFFWVARMIFSSLDQTGKIPFSTVLIHGLLRDEQGRKMSKSLGNGVDPLEMAEQYGADALRFHLLMGNSPGNDMRFFTDRCESMRNFANKLWNASRFVRMNLTISDCALPSVLTAEDKWVLSRLNRLIKETTDHMERYELGLAAQGVYDFIWDSYCDWFIELSKSRLQAADENENAQRVLCYVLLEILKLLHPFMPFITEEIWAFLPHGEGYLMCAQFPTFCQARHYPREEEETEVLMEAIRALRTKRAELSVPVGKKARLLVVTERKEIFERGRTHLMRLGFAESVEVCSSMPEALEGMISVSTPAAALLLPLRELVDVDRERAKLKKEREKQRAELEKLEKKLQNAGFLAKAPEQVVHAERQRRGELLNLLEKLDEGIRALK